VRPKRLPKRHVKLVLEKTKPLINFLPKRTPTNRFFFPPRSRALRKYLRPQSQSKPKRPIWGKLHSRHTLASPPRPAAPPPPPLRRKQGHRAIDLGGLFGNLFPRRGRPRGEGRSSEIQVKPYLGKPLPRPPGRPPTRNSKLLQRGKLVNQVPRGTLAQAISLGVVAAVLAV